MYKTSRPQEWRSKKSSDRSAREERLCARTTVVLPETFLKTNLPSLTIRRHFKNRPLLRLAPRHKKRPKSTPFVWSRARRAARVTHRVGASRPFFFFFQKSSHCNIPHDISMRSYYYHIIIILRVRASHTRTAIKTDAFRCRALARGLNGTEQRVRTRKRKAFANRPGPREPRRGRGGGREQP